MTGTIVKGIGGFYYIRTDEGVIECKARGIFRKNGTVPMIGDIVDISREKSGGSIEKIYERRNFLVRPPVANIDILAVVAACKNPDPNTNLLDKMLINAETAGIEPVICINKRDLASPKELEEVYRFCGYKIFAVCAADGGGIPELSEYIRGKTTAFSGLSGVGKSSIMNVITDNFMQTGDVSRINRGRHTTRHVELMPLAGGGYVLDTPGFGSMEITAEPSELYLHFPEMRNRVCRFRGCSHITEPDCGVKDALAAGEITAERYESYKEIYEDLKRVRKYPKN
ncbi:MAG: ribosome small subunit-dependent GTPase A [Oscillospiraceae bacterium]|nr:ribosome small subunit-dependent GTPase A [Oscillospiraceae bacterium]